MKKITCFITAILLVFNMIYTSADEIVKVYVNGTEVKTDTSAVIVNGSTMIPFRAILNALGVLDSQIIWEESSQSVEVKTENKYIFLAIANSAAISNDSMVMLNTPPYIKNGRIMVPVRFISEGLGANVEWDADNSKVLINK